MFCCCKNSLQRFIVERVLWSLLGFVCFVSLFLNHRLHHHHDEMWILRTAEEEEVVVGVLLCFFSFLSSVPEHNTTGDRTRCWKSM